MTIFSWSLYIDITILSYLCIKIVIIISNLIIVFINRQTFYVEYYGKERETEREEIFETSAFNLY